MKKRLIWSGLGIAAVALAVVSGQQTAALWSDEAEIGGGPITSGTLTFTLGSDTAQAEAFTFAALGRTAMSPGQYVQAPLVLANSGDVDVAYRLTGVSASDPALPLTITITTVGNTSACPGAGVPSGTQLLGGISPTAATTTPSALAIGARHVWCIRATVGAGASANQSTTLTFNFRAEQL